MSCPSQASLFCTLGRTLRSIVIILDDAFEKEGIALNLPQFIIMNILFHMDNLILEDLAKMLHKDKSAVLRNLKHLENEHFIAKITDKNDKRRKVLVVTQQGVEILKSARKVERKTQESFTQKISRGDLITFMNVLETLKSESTDILKNNIDKVN